MEKLNNIQIYMLKLCMAISLYIVIFMLFFSSMAINNPQMLIMSRTSAITAMSFLLLLIVMNTIYGKPNLGKRKRRLEFASFSLSVMFTDIITYIELQIMNVNPNNNATLVLFGHDFPLLIAAIICQLCWLYLVILVSDRIYYLLVAPIKCCIIADSQENANHIYRKLNTFRQKFNVESVYHFSCKDLHTKILDYNTIFLVGLNQDTRNDLELFCYRNKKEVYIAPNMENIVLSSSDQTVIDDAAFLYIASSDLSLEQKIIKRSFDLLFSIVGIIISFPIMFLSSIVIKLYDNGPIFFIQERATQNGKVFKIVKFRTMKTDADIKRGKNISAQDNDDRITKPGKLLRKLRLDEIPQLFNIFWGDMSFVGPRPEMLINVKEYTNKIPEFVYRQRVKAGLTGLAQIDGKYNTTAHDKLMLDLIYIETFSVLNDIKLLFRTFTVFFRNDSTEGFNNLRGSNIEIPKMQYFCKTINDKSNKL